jgi:hypothetical protein
MLMAETLRSTIAANVPYPNWCFGECRNADCDTQQLAAAFESYALQMYGFWHFQKSIIAFLTVLRREMKCKL